MLDDKKTSNKKDQKMNKNNTKKQDFIDKQSSFSTVFLTKSEPKQHKNKISMANRPLFDLFLIKNDQKRNQNNTKNKISMPNRPFFDPFFIKI